MKQIDKIYSLIILHMILVFVVLAVIPSPFGIIAAVGLFGPITVLFMALHKELDGKRNW